MAGMFQENISSGNTKCINKDFRVNPSEKYLIFSPWAILYSGLK